MFFEEANLRGGLARGAPSDLSGIVDASFESARVVDNLNARSVATERAYDSRSDAVFNATGVRLDNPMRMPVRGSILLGGAGFQNSAQNDQDEYQARLNELAEQFPDHRDIIAPDRPILDDAKGLARGAEHHLNDLMSRRSGMGKYMASLAGGLQAAFYDPVNALTLPIGAFGRVGLGAKQILWMGIKNGAINAGVETALQPIVQKWRSDAGLDASLERALINIGAAGLLGFGIDAGGRTLFRGAQKAAGRTPNLDDAGNVTGYARRGGAEIEPALALDELARNAPKNSLIRKAADGDALALKRLAKEAGIRDVPEIRAALNALDLEDELGSPLPKGVTGANMDEVTTRMSQAMRSAMDPDGMMAPPRSIELRPILKESEITPEIRAARDELQSGRLNVVEAARVMRQLPDAIDDGVELRTPLMQDARDLYYLSENAFARVEQGDVPAKYAVLVGRHIEDGAMHGRALDHMMEAGPRNRREAEFMVSDFMQANAPEFRHAQLLGARPVPDDAPDNVKKFHGPLRPAHVEEPGSLRVADDVFEVENMTVVVREELELADRLTKLSKLIEVCG